MARIYGREVYQVKIMQEDMAESDESSALKFVRRDSNMINVDFIMHTQI